MLCWQKLKITEDFLFFEENASIKQVVFLSKLIRRLFVLRGEVYLKKIRKKEDKMQKIEKVVQELSKEDNLWYADVLEQPEILKRIVAKFGLTERQKKQLISVAKKEASETEDFVLSILISEVQSMSENELNAWEDET